MATFSFWLDYGKSYSTPLFHLPHTTGGLGCRPPFPEKQIPFHFGCPAPPHGQFHPDAGVLCSLQRAANEEAKGIITRPWERQKSVLWMQCHF